MSDPADSIGEKTRSFAQPEEMRILEMKPGMASVCEPYNVEYSPNLARDRFGRIIGGVSQDIAREVLDACDYQMPTAAEIMALFSRGSDDRAFDDYFGRGLGWTLFLKWPEKRHFFEISDTSLAKPKGAKDDYKEIQDGKNYWVRVVKQRGIAVGEQRMPESGTIMQVSDFGLPLETRDLSPDGCCGKDVHYAFDPAQDEVAIMFEGRKNCSYNWRRKRSTRKFFNQVLGLSDEDIENHEAAQALPGCLHMRATYKPETRHHLFGFRPVRYVLLPQGI